MFVYGTKVEMPDQAVSGRNFSSEECDNHELIKKEKLTNSKNEEISEQEEVTKRKIPHEECDNYELVKKQKLSDSKNEEISELVEKEKLTDSKNEEISEQEVTKGTIPHEESDNSLPVEKEELTNTENGVPKESVSKQLTKIEDEAKPEYKFCCKKSYSAEAYKRHVDTPHHKKRIKYRLCETFHCKPCNKRFSGLSDYNTAHLKSKSHEKRINMLKQEKLLKLKESKKLASKKNKHISCKACDKMFKDFIDLDAHWSSSNHKGRLQEIVMREQAYCQPCNKFFYELDDYASHLRSKGHRLNTR